MIYSFKKTKTLCSPSVQPLPETALGLETASCHFKPPACTLFRLVRSRSCISAEFQLTMKMIRYVHLRFCNFDHDYHMLQKLTQA